MIDELKGLNAAELELIYKSPIITCILISGADGNIDKREVSTAIKTSRKNAKRKRAMLYHFYNELAEDFEIILNKLIEIYPSDVQERNERIVKELSGLNVLFNKLDKTFSIVYYASLLDIAKIIAKSSGGLFGLRSISKEEKEFLDLPMIDDPSILF